MVTTSVGDCLYVLVFPLFLPFVRLLLQYSPVPIVPPFPKFDCSNFSYTISRVLLSFSSIAVLLSCPLFLSTVLIVDTLLLFLPFLFLMHDVKGRCTRVCSYHSFASLLLLWLFLFSLVNSKTMYLNQTSVGRALHRYRRKVLGSTPVQA